MESKQNVPGFISSIPETEDNGNGDSSSSNNNNTAVAVLLMECPFCGGLGHKLNQCHKLENQRMKMLQNNTNNVLSYTSI